jgi:glycosyltransferase involved in cell wall biosynthesis
MYNDIWMRLNAYLINRRISHYKVDEVVLHIWRPRFKYALDLIKYDKTIYHVDDNYSFSSTIQSRELSKNERELLKQCDFSFIHSKTLFNEQSKLSKNPYLLPNGVDLSLYNDRTYDFDIRAERFDKFDIILGYVGAIKRHLNLPLLLEIANNRKDICIVFVGQIKVNHKEVPEIVTKLQILENVFFEGIVKAEIVPTYLRAFNIGLMPYKQNAYTRNIYPLKMHEYFAAGLPVISTRLENILEFKKSLYFAHTREEYFEIINKVRNQSHEERVNKTKSLIKVARENSWDKRVHTMLEILEYNEEVQ